MPLAKPINVTPVLSTEDVTNVPIGISREVPSSFATEDEKQQDLVTFDIIVQPQSDVSSVNTVSSLNTVSESQNGIDYVNMDLTKLPSPIYDVKDVIPTPSEDTRSRGRILQPNNECLVM